MIYIQNFMYVHEWMSTNTHVQICTDAPILHIANTQSLYLLFWNSNFSDVTISRACMLMATQNKHKWILHDQLLMTLGKISKVIFLLLIKKQV